ncbi:MAG: peptide ABC transporter substrate-binding protein [Hyphomonadaceae bacterium]|nr:peptide ABC transporter substrate-binding protein [Hyphomonadaceae bacterium]
MNWTTNRRGVIGMGGAAALGAGALVSGCGGRVIGLDVERRILDIGNQAEPLSLDPHKASGQWENRIIGEMFIGLTTEDAQGQPIPGMAESWTVSEDGLVWTFQLRQADWSDGMPCTAYDFEFAFRRILSPDTIAEYAQVTYAILNAQNVKEGKAPVTDVGVRALDERTLEMRLEHPAPYLPGLLKHYTHFPIPKHVVERVGDDWIKPANIQVNGPFRLEKWWSNYVVHLVKNPAFFDARNVVFNDLYFYPTNNDDAASRRVMNGELGWSTSFPGKKQAFYEKALPGFVKVAPYMLLQYFSLNTTRPPFNDKRVRRAMTLALDRTFLAEKIWQAGYKPAWSFVPPGMYGYPQGGRLDFADTPLEARRAEARALLEAAGYGPDNPLKFTFSHRNTQDNPQVAVVAQADWRAVAPWVEVTLAGVEGQIHYANMRAKNFDCGDGGWIADYNDAYTYLYLLETRTGPQNYSGYSNPEYDRLMEASTQERDAVVRAGLMRDAEQIMLDDSPVIPVGFGASRNLVDPRIVGFEDNLEDIHRTRWMSLKA